VLIQRIAPIWGTGGRGFKSRLSDQKTLDKMSTSCGSGLFGPDHKKGTKGPEKALSGTEGHGSVTEKLTEFFLVCSRCIAVGGPTFGCGFSGTTEAQKNSARTSRATHAVGDKAEQGAATGWKSGPSLGRRGPRTVSKPSS
jgi:hypothetical protein